MAVMQRQESFNRFYQEFVVDEAPRCTEGGPLESGICVYKNEDTGKGCAIGIQPEFQEIYQRKFEEISIEILYKSYPEVQGIIASQDLYFFKELQALHDTALQFQKTFQGKLRRFADDWKIKIPERVEEATE